MATYEFTNLNGGANYTGPTSPAGYNGTTLEGLVTINGGIQEWTVPSTGSYTIEAWGASGADGQLGSLGTGDGPIRFGGIGRHVKITTTLTQGTVIYILVGQGGHCSKTPYPNCGGGGGGSFVTTAKGSGAVASEILVIAGGGGGGGKGTSSSGTGQSPQINARSVTEDGGYSYDYPYNGNLNPGGTGGSGGQYAPSGARQAQGSTGGGGFLTNGSMGYPSSGIARGKDIGKSFRNGGEGGEAYTSGWGDDYGGFGGGGAQPHWNHVGGGGGGGYNGGAPGGNWNGAWSGGGGSSYSSVDPPDIDEEWTDSRSSHTALGRHGKVTITGGGDPPEPEPEEPEPEPVQPIPTTDITYTILKDRYIQSGITSASGHANIILAGRPHSFSTHTFTNCGATGKNGPSLLDCTDPDATNSYGGSGISWWNNTDYFNVSGESGVNGIQFWTVPDTGYYEVDAYGARGGGILDNPTGASGGGLGSRIKSRFSLTAGDKYIILCGQQGQEAQEPSAASWGSSGGGGTFFVKGNDYSNVDLDDLQLVAGGGGGRGASFQAGVINHGESGQSGSSDSTEGGPAGQYGAGGGGGLITNGLGTGYSHPFTPTGGISFKNGGGGGSGGDHGSYVGVEGGFGGGGGASVHSGGGGGGVYGGGGANPYNSNPNGHGGGSHYKGTIITNTSGVNDGDGKIIITATTSSGTPRSVSFGGSGSGALSDFRNATFIEGDPVPASLAISINTDFKDRTFGEPPEPEPEPPPAPSAIYEFTNLNGGASYTGPTSPAGYNGTALEGLVTINGGIQEWTVPSTGTYTVEAWGASGGDGQLGSLGIGSGPIRFGGVGRYVKITTTLTQGTVIYILVGQGGHCSRTPYPNCGGGGGGSFVTTAKGSGAIVSDILVIAGGGGGGGKGSGTATGQSPQINARSVTEDGGYSYDYYSNGNLNPGGSGGNGGQYAAGGYRQSQGSTGGGGFLTDGVKGYYSREIDVGKSFRNGGEGGQASVYDSDYGGFGGGGSQPHSNHVGGAGGGGYNGGAPGGNWNGAWSGGGGSSYSNVAPDVDIEWTENRSNHRSLGRHGKITISVV